MQVYSETPEDRLCEECSGVETEVHFVQTQTIGKRKGVFRRHDLVVLTKLFVMYDFSV